MRTAQGIAYVLLVFVALAVLGVLSSSPDKQKNQSQPTEEYYRIPDVFLLDDVGRGTETLFGFFDKHHEGIEAFATAAVAIFTWTLWRATDKLWLAGQQTVATMEATERRQLRAYVGVEKLDIILRDNVKQVPWGPGPDPFVPHSEHNGEKRINE